MANNIYIEHSIRDGIRRIRNYCKAHPTCEGCGYKAEHKGCYFKQQITPRDWDEDPYSDVKNFKRRYKCRDCIYLSDNKTVDGYECYRPNHKWPTEYAKYKWKGNYACAAFILKGENEKN